ncbi:MAG: aminotransferase class V-fold PLP-dependent enzyme [Chloroflexi bacterium]|nr:aminotransferase class V-fold PLP-dependent enzyme [Chloroflexota bacterium]
MIYLDNAATSCPKPAVVVAAVTQALENVCANPSRGAYEISLEASRTIMRTRRALAHLFNAADESRVLFTLNATHALNLALKGLLTRGSRGDGRSRLARPRHVVTSSLEHNSVARPLAALERQGVEVTRVRCAADGTTTQADILAAVRDDTALVALTHASNVLGTLLPIAEVGVALRDRGIPLLVDAAQTAGVFPIDMQEMGISLLATSGHKGLQGPQGVGILCVSPELELETLVEGGTGSESESLEHPSVCPDRHEAGTLNGPGIAGLGAGVKVVQQESPAAIGRREYRLTARLVAHVQHTDAIRVFGPWASGQLSVDKVPADPLTANKNGQRETHEEEVDASRDAQWLPPCAPLISLAIDGLASAEVARILDKQFHIAVRAGLHCAPEAHRAAGTLETGLVRLSVGHATTEAEIDQAAEALLEIASRPAAYWLQEWSGHYAP